MCISNNLVVSLSTKGFERSDTVCDTRPWKVKCIAATAMLSTWQDVVPLLAFIRASDIVTARVVVLTFDNHNPPPLPLWAACITIQCVVLRWLKFQRHTNKQRLLWHWNALQNKLFDSAYLEVWSNRCYISLKCIVPRCARYCYKLWITTITVS